MNFPPYWIHRHAVLGLGTFTWSIRNQGVELVFVVIILAKSEAYLKFKFWGKGYIAHPPNRYPRVTIKIGWCFPRASSDTKKLERFRRRRRYAFVLGKTCPIKDESEVGIAETLVFCICKNIIWNLLNFQIKKHLILPECILCIWISQSNMIFISIKVRPWILVESNFVIKVPSFRIEFVMFSEMWWWWSFSCFWRLFWTFDFSSLFFVLSLFPFCDLDFDFRDLIFSEDATNNFVLVFFVSFWCSLIGFLLGFIISVWIESLACTLNNPAFTANEFVSFGIAVLTPGLKSLLAPGLERGRSFFVIEGSVLAVIGLFSTSIVTSRLVTHRHRRGI